MTGVSSAGVVSLWRISKETTAFGAADLSGEGARRFGGRWNAKGQAVVYCSTTIALAALETLAHVDGDFAVRNRFLVRVSVPLDVFEAAKRLNAGRLSPAWAAQPPGITSAMIGGKWLASMSTCLLVVPSVLVPEEHNVLINPRHPDARRIRAKVVRPFAFDARMEH